MLHFFLSMPCALDRLLTLLLVLLARLFGSTTQDHPSFYYPLQ